LLRNIIHDEPFNFFSYSISMDSVSDIKGEMKGFGGFFKYVFDFDETNKALMFNMVQYAILALIPSVLALKGISYVIPEEDEEKGSLEISAEVLGQVLLLIICIWFINRMIRYIPTYSGVEYHSFNELNFIIPLLIVILTMQTRLGEKIRILSERVMELWEGRNGEKKDEKKDAGKGGAVKVTQPLAGGRGAAPLVNSSTLGINSMGGGMPQVGAQSAAAMTPPYQTPDFDQMYQNDLVPLMDAAEPMAANETGNPWSAW